MARIPKLSFVVVTFNGGTMLQECLRSLESQSYEDFEVIVVDNGSSDGSCQAAQRQMPNAVHLRLEENRGFAEANNFAIASASGAFIALINNDVTLEPDWAAWMMGALAGDPLAGSAACRTLQARSPDYIDSAGFAFYASGGVNSFRGASQSTYDHAAHAPFGAVASACVYVRAAFETVGGFHPEYFCYYEDTDLAVRLTLWGYRTLYVPGALAYHLGGGTAGNASNFQVYHLRRNAELLYWVDMVGSLAWLNLPWHIGQELAALVAATLNGQAGVVVSAKRDAWSRRAWIVERRRMLRAALARKRGVGSAQLTLLRALRVGMPLGQRLREWTSRRGASSEVR